MSEHKQHNLRCDEGCENHRHHHSRSPSCKCGHNHEKLTPEKQKIMLTRIGITIIFTICILLLKPTGTLNVILSFTAYVVIGYDILIKAVKGVTKGKGFDENFLMAIATLGAIFLAFYSKSYDFFEAIAVMLFYQIGEFFQSYAIGKSRKSISELMDIRPDYAVILKNGILEKVDPHSVPVGSIIVVSPGEKVPIDGIIEKGESSIDTVALTGESLPRQVTLRDEIISGSVNISSVLQIRTTKKFEKSTASEILSLAENAGKNKSKTESFISRFASIYTPVVCICALLLAVLPPIINILLENPAEAGKWLYRALTFLVISCPCALVISIPLTFFAGIGGASLQGILIKGSDYLESLSKTDTVVFDKTGTLTKGTFEVSEIHTSNYDENELLKYAAYAEYHSSHPISKSLKSAYKKEIDTSKITNVTEYPGKGIYAEINNTPVAIGNKKLFDLLNTDYPENQDMTGTFILISINGEYKGTIVVSDTIKETSYKAINELKKCCVNKTVMLTGDINTVAQNVAEKLNITEYYSELLPQDKVSVLKELLLKKDKDKKLIFAGDGINDAPVLALADIGVAMGALGSSAAIEAADVVLMDDDLSKLPKAIKFSKKCMGIVYQNIVFALGIKLICLVSGALGITNMWAAVFADVGVMVLAVINAIRAMKTK